MALKLPMYPVEYLDIIFSDEQINAKNVTLQHQQILPFAASGIYKAPLKSARFLTQGDDVKTVLDICLDTKDANICYNPGNTFGILPQNNNEEVNKLIERLKYDDIADKLFNLSVKAEHSKKKIPPHIPVTGTIRELFLHNLDIRSVPKKLFLRALSKYTQDEDDINRINELCSTQGAEKYTNFITNEYVTLLELLTKFPSCFPPVTVLLEHLPRLSPRPYSVACSPLYVSPAEVHFVFSLTKLPNSYEGVCTGWLNKNVNSFHKNLTHELDNIRVYLRTPTNFSLPESTATNVIMIGSGTGIAPFIGFLQHRAIQMKQNQESFGTMWLFYGCRYSNRDFLYKHDIEHYLSTNVLTKLFTCFSRDSSNIKYVQDLICENAEDFVNMINQNTVIYVCGGKNMSSGVFDSVCQCLVNISKYSLDDAQKYLNNLKIQNMYIEDIWS